MAKPFVNPFVSGQFLELRVDALVSDGRGLGRHDGVVVLVEDALPGQLVRARVAAVRKSLAEAALVEVLERSPDEQEPPCPHAGRCGGCSWQSLAYGRQLAWKERIVHDALERVGKVACPPMLPILPSPPSGDTATRWSSPLGCPETAARRSGCGNAVRATSSG